MNSYHRSNSRRLIVTVSSFDNEFPWVFDYIAMIHSSSFNIFIGIVDFFLFWTMKRRGNGPWNIKLFRSMEIRYRLKFTIHRLTRKKIRRMILNVSLEMFLFFFFFFWIVNVSTLCGGRKLRWILDKRGLKYDKKGKWNIYRVLESCNSWLDMSFFYETAYEDYHGLACCLNLKCCTTMLIVWIILWGICEVHIW